MYDGMQNESNISLVIIRIELDDKLDLENFTCLNYKCKEIFYHYSYNYKQFSKILND
jgi:hypothetical protein